MTDDAALSALLAAVRTFEWGDNCGPTPTLEAHDECLCGEPCNVWLAEFRQAAIAYGDQRVRDALAPLREWVQAKHSYGCAFIESPSHSRECDCTAGELRKRLAEAEAKLGAKP